MQMTTYSAEWSQRVGCLVLAATTTGASDDVYDGTRTSCNDLGCAWETERSTSSRSVLVRTRNQNGVLEYQSCLNTARRIEDCVSQCRQILVAREERDGGRGKGTDQRA